MGYPDGDAHACCQSCGLPGMTPSLHQCVLLFEDGLGSILSSCLFFFLTSSLFYYNYSKLFITLLASPLFKLHNAFPPLPAFHTMSSLGHPCMAECYSLLYITSD